MDDGTYVLYGNTYVVIDGEWFAETSQGLLMGSDFPSYVQHLTMNHATITDKDL